MTAAAAAQSRTIESEGPAIETAGLAKRFGRAWALRGVDLEVGRGERVLVVGENGSGKSTFLRLLALTSRATRGTVRLAGHAPDSRAMPLRQQLTHLPDRPAYYGALTPYENLEFACRMHGRPAHPLAIRAALRSVGLDDVADAPAHTLSRGMTQRMALAGALLRPTRVLLLDEPYTALDTAGIAWVDEWLDRLRADGVTVVVATHLVTPRARANARVLTLRDGRIADPEGSRASRQLLASSSRPQLRVAPHDELPPSDAPWHRALAIARKDLCIERRTGASLGAMICFAAVVLLLFGFALGPGAPLHDASAGLVWVTVLLAAVLVLDRASQLESEHGGWDVFRASAGARWPIYAGKVIACTVLLALVELALLPCAVVLYDLDVPSPAALLRLCAIAVLTTLAIVAIGMLYAVLTANIRARQVLLPLLLFPIMIPVLLAAVKTTGLVLFGDPMHEFGAWTRMLVAADLIYSTLGACTFAVLLDE